MKVLAMASVMFLFVTPSWAAPAAKDESRQVPAATFDALCGKEGNCKAPTCTQQSDNKVSCKCETDNEQTASSLVTTAAPEKNGFRLACIPSQMLPR